MVRQLGAKEALGSPGASRWPRGLQRQWLRKAVPHPRRHTTNSVAPHAALSLASGMPLVIGWSHAVTSGGYHGASLWFTTLCALSVALGALSYNLMAVLAEFFNFDRRTQQVQARIYLHGVDVTNSRFFQLPAVLASVDFAADAHKHQRRKTGEPYVTHCIETALIVEACLPQAYSGTEQERHVNCIMAAVLHDVIDDTPIDLSAMQHAFGPRVAALVTQVSKLSQMNQLLRRGKRQGWAQYSPDHFKQLRKLIVDLAFEEPLVILVKLADRLHNMRTVYVLAPDKQRSVAEETLEVWCSMAESLGWDGLKSEMEDLCFAVLQPSSYCTMRAELDRLWSLPTLAVVEEQLEDDAAEAAEAAGGDGLGLRIVQVSGPEAPVRHYTRAAGVRAASSSRPASSRRQGMRRGGREVAAAEAPAMELAQTLAAEAAVAAEAVPVPVARSKGSAAAAGSAAMAVAVAAVAAPVAVLEGEPEVGERVLGAAAAAALAAAAEPSSSSLSSLTDAADDDGVAAAALRVLVAAPSTSSSYSVDVTASTDGSATEAGAGWGLTGPTARRAVGPTEVGSSSNSSNNLSSSGSGSSGSSYGDDGAAAAVAYPLASYGTLDSVDGPMLLDSIVLPFGLTTSAELGSSTSSSAASSADDVTGASGPRGPPPSPGPGSSFLLSPRGRSGGPPGAQQQPPLEPQNPLQPLLSAALPPPLRPLLQSAAEVLQPIAVLGAGLGSDGGGGGGGAMSELPPAQSLPLVPLSPQQDRLKLILSTVVPFESVGFKSLRGLSSSTRRGLEVLDECAALLYNEIMIRSQAGGLGINIQGRLKSLQSVYRKMVRKKVAVAQVYDSRALRVIVDDGDGSSLQEAVEVCYRLVNAVHSIWKPIKREFDDYIANPKQSGYQALHTAVRGPGGIPMEVQIKTSSMHDLAEYGAAAHWVYKEYTPMLQSPGRPRGGGGERLPAGFVGQPLLKVAKDKLRYGVVISREDDGQRLVAAVKLGATFRPFPTRVPDFVFYAGLLSYTQSKGWQVPGHGDLMLRLEEFVKCDDGRYHRRDHMGYLIPAETVTLLEGFEEDVTAAREAAAAAAAVAAAAAMAAATTPAAVAAAQAAVMDAAASGGGAAGGGGGEGRLGADLRSSIDDDVLATEGSEQRRFREQMRVTFAKTQQLRSMIEWGRGAIGKYATAEDFPSDEVSILIWPGGNIEHFSRGTTAGDIVAEKGLIQTGEGCTIFLRSATSVSSCAALAGSRLHPALGPPRALADALAAAAPPAAVPRRVQWPPGERRSGAAAQRAGPCERRGATVGGSSGGPQRQPGSLPASAAARLHPGPQRRSAGLRAWAHGAGGPVQVGAGAPDGLLQGVLRQGHAVGSVGSVGRALQGSGSMELLLPAPQQQQQHHASAPLTTECVSRMLTRLACSGGTAHLDWLADRLEVCGVRLPQHLTQAQAKLVITSGNAMAMRWLRDHNLLPSSAGGC